MIAYVDASVILRLALGAPNRLAEWAAVERANSSELLWTECRRSLDRLRAHGRLDDDGLVSAVEAVNLLLDRMDLAAVGKPVLARAGDPFPTPLGTLDAIHLATALLWDPAPEAFLTHDLELGRAARSMGLRVLGC